MFFADSAGFIVADSAGLISADSAVVFLWHWPMGNGFGSVVADSAGFLRADSAGFVADSAGFVCRHGLENKDLRVRKEMTIALPVIISPEFAQVRHSFARGLCAIMQIWSVCVCVCVCACRYELECKRVGWSVCACKSVHLSV